MQNKHTGRSIQKNHSASVKLNTASRGGEPIGETGTKLSWKSFQWNLFGEMKPKSEKKKTPRNINGWFTWEYYTPPR